jgi:hypothetical protein
MVSYTAAAAIVQALQSDSHVQTMAILHSCTKWSCKLYLKGKVWLSNLEDLRKKSSPSEIIMAHALFLDVGRGWGKGS